MNYEKAMFLSSYLRIYRRKANYLLRICNKLKHRVGVRERKKVQSASWLERSKWNVTFLVTNRVHTWSSGLLFLLLLLFKNSAVYARQSLLQDMCYRAEALADTSAARKLVSLASCEDKG